MTTQTSLAYPARPVPGAIPPWTFPAAAAGRLGNGLTTLHSALPGRRLAAVRLLLDTGAAREPSGLDGIATLTGRVLTEGTTVRGGNAFAAALERIGATLYGSAGLVTLQVSLDVAVTRLGAAMELLAEAVRSPALADSEIRRLGRERIDEIGQDEADPRSRAIRELRAVMFTKDSRVARPTGGDRETVARLGGEEVTDFYGGTDPAAATVVTAGDFSGVDIDALLAEALGDWASPDRTLPEPGATTGIDGPQLVIVHRTGAVQTQLAFGHHVPGRDHGDWAPLTVASQVLGGGLSSRLNAVLREEKGYTYGMHAGLMRLRDRGLFLAEGAVHTEVTGPAVADALAGLRSILEGITADECHTAVRSLADSAPTRYETARSVAAEIADAVAGGLPADHPRRYFDAVRATTHEAAAAAYARHIDPKALTVIAVGDADQIQEPLEKLDFAEVTVVR
jgi:predicted Zn-dependent peptidase